MAAEGEAPGDPGAIVLSAEGGPSAAAGSCGDGAESAASTELEPWTVVEFFAGMGGMRAAGLESGIPMKVVAAYEVSEICQEAYRHNYGGEEWRLKTIEQLSTEELDAQGADVWHMSPPCQPFTRSGRRQDHEDNRTQPLLHLIHVLGEMRRPPRRLLVENVIGFERSESRRRLLGALAARGWEGAEFALDPEEFGLPNRRPRYYGLFRAATGCGESTSHSGVACCWRPVADLLKGEGPDAVPLLQGAPWEAQPPPPLGEFLQDMAGIAQEESELQCSLEVSQEVLKARDDKAGKFDIHLRSDRTSACLTKVNGRLPRGFSPLIVVDEAEAGPLEQRPKVSAQGHGPGAATDHVWKPGVRVRYLSPTEQLRLMGYPESYSFPPRLGFRERSGLIGNSLNVCIVSWLLRVLLLARGDVAPLELPPHMVAPVRFVQGVEQSAERHERPAATATGPRCADSALVERGWGPRVRQLRGR